MKKALLIALGSITFALAMIGIVIRGLPTTPLLLLTLSLWTKSSNRLSAWLRGSWFHKRFLLKYEERKALTLKEKISIQVFASTMMLVSFIIVDNIFMRVFLVICFVIHHYIFIFKIKTAFKD